MDVDSDSELLTKLASGGSIESYVSRPRLCP